MTKKSELITTLNATQDRFEEIKNIDWEQINDFDVAVDILEENTYLIEQLNEIKNTTTNPKKYKVQAQEILEKYENCYSRVFTKAYELRR